MICWSKGSKKFIYKDKKFNGPNNPHSSTLEPSFPWAVGRFEHWKKYFSFLVWTFCGKAQWRFLGDLPKTMRKQCPSTKFPHQEIRLSYSIFCCGIRVIIGFRCVLLDVYCMSVLSIIFCFLKSSLDTRKFQYQI